MDGCDATAGDCVDDGEPEEVELTAAEREGFARLPERAAPSDLLEERVVGALRSRGILGPRSTPVETKSGGGRTARSGGAWWTSPWSWAAGLVLFMGGGLAGHGIGARTTADAFLAVRQQDAALQVQEAGTAYVSALMALEALQEGNGEGGGAAGTAREVASSTLLAAASAYSRLDPDGPLTPMLTTLLEEQMQPGSAGTSRQQTIWF